MWNNPCLTLHFFLIDHSWFRYKKDELWKRWNYRRAEDRIKGWNYKFPHFAILDNRLAHWWREAYVEAVRVIKEAILRSQYRAASSANKEQLSLYYGIGCYVSKNSREGFWGKGAIETISQQLQKELPGLRGFSVANIKFMRQFYETWCEDLKSLTAVSEIDTQLLIPYKILAAAYG